MIWVFLGIGFFIYQVFISDDLSKSSLIDDGETPTPTQQLQTEQSTTQENELTPIAKDDQKRVYAVREKYLSQYTLEVGDDPLIFPASVVSMNGKCKAYNQYGDLLNIPNEQCLYMLAQKGRIPQRRDTANNQLQNKPLQDEPSQGEQSKQQNAQFVQGITTTEEYIFTDKSKTEPIFN